MPSILDTDTSDFREHWPFRCAEKGGMVVSEPNEDLFFK